MAPKEPVDPTIQQAIDMEMYCLMLADVLSTTSFNPGALATGLVVAGAKVFAQNWQGDKASLEKGWTEMMGLAKSRMLQVYSHLHEDPDTKGAQPT